MGSLPSNDGCFATSSLVALRLSVGICGDVKRAATSRSPTTPVATGIARSARGRSKLIGWKLSAPTCSTCRIIISSSRCLRPSAPWRCRTSERSTGCCFGLPPRRSRTIARDERHLGARIGFTAVLHTWGQRLEHHPHVHCVVPAGGLCPDGQRWILARAGFFLPVRVLSRLFRGKYLAYLREAYQAGYLVLAGRLKGLAQSCAWQAFLAPLYTMDWVVYAKPPFGSPEQVLKYLAQYTHRVAISNRRLLSLEDGQVAFRYKDYRRGQRECVMRLTAVEFMRRFLLHVLPKGFVRIRHYGFLANRCRRDNLRLCRRLLGWLAPPGPEPTLAPDAAACEGHTRCPACRQAPMLIVAKLPPSRAGPNHAA